MRVAAYQFDVRRGEVEANLARVEAGLTQAAESRVELVLLPEMWPTSFVSEGEDAIWLERTTAALERVRELSRELGIVVAGSAFGAGEPGERLRNRLHVFARGEDVLTYDKVHLFSLAGEQMGFSRGRSAPPTIDLDGLRLSGCVCYDLRFASLLALPLREGAELLLVSAQWPVPRASHWDALLIGRAVEHQAFVLGTNRTGRDQVGRRRLDLDFPGNSMIVSPNGEVLARGTGQEGLIEAEIDLEEVRSLRSLVPVRADERRVPG